MEPTISVFVSYSTADRDKDLYKKLKTSLKPLQQHFAVSPIYDQDTASVGKIKAEEFISHLDESSLILLLLSPDYLEQCGREIEQVFQRKKEGQRIIPILLRHCDWKNDEHLKDLEILPRNDQPVAEQNL